MSVLVLCQDPPCHLVTFLSVKLRIIGSCVVQIWNLGSPEPNFTLEAHQKGVNCVEYFNGGDRPHLITGSDDQTAKVCNLKPAWSMQWWWCKCKGKGDSGLYALVLYIRKFWGISPFIWIIGGQVWDYQTKSCVQTLEGHTHNVSAVCFHPELPIILTGSEDGSVRIWHATTYRWDLNLVFIVQSQFLVFLFTVPNFCFSVFFLQLIVLRLVLEFSQDCKVHICVGLLWLANIVQEILEL